MKKFLLGFIVALTAISLFSDTATIDGIDESARAAVIKDVKFRQRYPWNNKVDIDYTIVGETNVVIVSFIVKDNDVGKTYTPLSFDKEPPITEGTHRITWDADADKISITSTSVVVGVEFTPPPLYIVVDLSGGTSAANYPVTKLYDVPAGGWTDEYKTTKLVLRKITAGKMPRTDVDITLTKDYYVGVFEVTQRQWELVMGTSPSNWSGNTLPVEKVSYNNIRGTSNGSQWPASNAVDATSFMGKLRAKTGIAFDLPTEAQWEYACRAGSSGDWGLLADGTMGTLDAMGWYSGNSSKKTHAVGTKTANAWGLYDMHGNVWEWCLDRSGGSYSGEDPVGGTSDNRRFVRGSSWLNDASTCTASNRYNEGPDIRVNDFGLRVAAPARIYIAQTYKVTFNANGGEGTMPSQTFTHGVEQALYANTFTREGYTFAGWATSADGEVVYSNGQSVKNLSSTDGATINLYAVWTDRVQLWSGGPYWAVKNVGAENPEDYGYYFWWGDTIGYKRVNDKWVASYGSSSNFSFTPSNVPTYDKFNSTLQSEGWITSSGVLTPSHDAARAHLGSNWRMPTNSELQALIDNCTWTWNTINGVNGYIVSGKGAYLGASIFLPAAGYSDGTSLRSAGLDGWYWSSVRYFSDYDACTSWYLYFYSPRYGYGYRDMGDNSRSVGGSVRPVLDVH